MDDLVLPPLPEPSAHQLYPPDVPLFNAKQMREYAKLAVEAENEACAQVAEDTKAPFTALAIRARH